MQYIGESEDVNQLIQPRTARNVHSAVVGSSARERANWPRALEWPGVDYGVDLSQLKLGVRGNGRAVVPDRNVAVARAPQGAFRMHVESCQLPPVLVAPTCTSQTPLFD